MNYLGYQMYINFRKLLYNINTNENIVLTRFNDR